VEKCRDVLSHSWSCASFMNCVPFSPPRRKQSAKFRARAMLNGSRSTCCSSTSTDAADIDTTGAAAGTAAGAGSARILCPSAQALCCELAMRN
jgi:hypothetical protein